LEWQIKIIRWDNELDIKLFKQWSSKKEWESRVHKEEHRIKEKSKYDSSNRVIEFRERNGEFQECKWMWNRRYKAVDEKNQVRVEKQYKGFSKRSKENKEKHN